VERIRRLQRAKGWRRRGRAGRYSPTITRSIANVRCACEGAVRRRKRVRPMETKIPDTSPPVRVTSCWGR
jgi:hypothetical protein